MKTSTEVAAAFVLMAAILANNLSAQTAAPPPEEFPLWRFDATAHDTCAAKGRLQDKEYCRSQLMDQIIAKGKASIPVLISQLTDTRRTREPIHDYWNYTTAGDIAHFILTDFFTGSDWVTHTMPGMEVFTRECDPGVSGERCWRQFLKEHGRKFVQEWWAAAWNVNKDRIFWDERARCFRLATNAEAK